MTRLTIVVKKQLKNALNAWALANIAGKKGGDNITVELSATGNAPVTHYWFSWVPTDEVKTTVLAYLNGNPNADIFEDTSNQDVLSAMGLKVITNES